MKTTLRMIVACHGFDGPDLFFLKVRATDEELDEGLHYEAAKMVARGNGYDGSMVAFDELDAAGKAMLNLSSWKDTLEVDCDKFETS